MAKDVVCRYCGRPLHRVQIKVQGHGRKRGYTVTTLHDDDDKGTCHLASGAITLHEPIREGDR